MRRFHVDETVSVTESAEGQFVLYTEASEALQGVNDALDSLQDQYTVLREQRDNLIAEQGPMRAELEKLRTFFSVITEMVDSARPRDVTTLEQAISIFQRDVGRIMGARITPAPASTRPTAGGRITPG